MTAHRTATALLSGSLALAVATGLMGTPAGAQPSAGLDTRPKAGGPPHQPPRSPRTAVRAVLPPTTRCERR